MVIAEHGYLGLAPDSARKGDIVTLLLGGEVPIVIRPLKEKGAYTLFGKCCLYGFVDGENLSKVRKLVRPDFNKDSL